MKKLIRLIGLLSLLVMGLQIPTSTYGQMMQVFQASTCSLTASISGTNLTCNGNASGTVTLSSITGTSPYKYNWSNGATTQNLTGLAIATYTVTITDLYNCTVTKSQTLTQPTVLSFTKTSVNIPACGATTTGSITISASGGTGTIVYSKDNGSTYQGGSLFSLLTAGTYTLKVKDANACVTAAQTVIITHDVAVSITGISGGTVTNFPTCNNGSITISATGGEGVYTFSKNGGSTYQSNSTFNTLTTGTYTCFAKDPNGCTSSMTKIVTGTGGCYNQPKEPEHYWVNLFVLLLLNIV